MPYIVCQDRGSFRDRRDVVLLYVAADMPTHSAFSWRVYMHRVYSQL
jgi:hypothetical protein